MEQPTSMDTHTTITDLRQAVSRFVAARQWESYHTPKNLSMSIAIVTVQIWGKGIWRRRAWHFSRGFCPCANHVPTRLASAMRVALPASLRVPPLILRGITWKPAIALSL